MEKQFSRTALESLPPPQRRAELDALAAVLTKRLMPYREWDAYWQEVSQIIADLKAVGHDLWSHDYDGARRFLWGWDYMRLETAGFLQIQFDYEGTVRTFWRGEDDRLGILNGE